MSNESDQLTVQVKEGDSARAIGQIVAAEVLATLSSPAARLGKDSLPANLEEAARMLGHSYFWLSRNYRKLGLRPSRVGGKLLFDRREVGRLIESLRVAPRPGRPRRSSF